MPQLSEEPKDILLPVPLLRQKFWCSCGLASIVMAMKSQGFRKGEEEMGDNPLIQRRFLRRYGFGPGRLGRIALSYGYEVTIIDGEPRDVGVSFGEGGGIHIRRDPTWRDILDCLERGIPAVCCIPDKREAFENCSHGGSHWVTIRGYRGGDFLIHDPAPWRKAPRCRAGYWLRWGCSLIAIARGRVETLTH
jgi:hypothetical protein